MMHTANWSSSHEGFFYRLTLELRSLNKTYISIIWKNLSGIRIFLPCASLLFFLLVVINLCPPNSAMRCQDTWTNIILSVSMRAFFTRLTPAPVDWAKQISLPNMGEPHPVSWKPEWNKKTEIVPLARRSSSCLASWVGLSACPAFELKILKNQLFLGFQSFGLSTRAYSINAPMLRFGIKLECRCCLRKTGTAWTGLETS